MAAVAYPVTDPAAAKPVVTQALEAQGFDVAWTDDWSAVAEIGSSKGVALAGGFRPHIRLQVSVTAADEGAWVQVVQATTGAAGGLLGLSKTKKAWKATTESVATALGGSSLLSGPPQES